MSNLNINLLTSLHKISITYKSGSRNSPEATCSRLGVTTNEVIDEYGNNPKIIKELNALVDAGYVIKSTQPGGSTKWMPTEKEVG